MQHRPRKRFGQNFLQDRFVIHRIVDAISPARDDSLIEIGPGQGAITLHLLPRVELMQAIELDRDLLAPLAEAAARVGELVLHNEDVLKFDFRAARLGEQPLRVIGNLPYNISTPVLFHLLEQADAIQDMHFMLQKEVVERMAAPAGSHARGRLSLMIQARCRVQPLFDIPPEAFRPQPQVTSSFVRLIPLETPRQAGCEASFAELVSRAFSQRRKTLRNSLASLVTPEDFAHTGIDPGERAERLELDDFLALARAIDSKRASAS